MKTQTNGQSTPILKLQPQGNNGTQMNRKSFRQILDNVITKTTLLAIVVICSLGTPSKASAQCWFSLSQSTVVAAPGQPVNVAGNLYGLSPYVYLETYSQSGNFTLSPLNVWYTPGPGTVGPSQTVYFPQSPMHVGVEGVIPISAGSGQTAHVTLIIYDFLGQFLCGTTITVEAVDVPALSAEMNTIGGDNETDEYYKGLDLNLYQLSWTSTWQPSANITALSGYAPLLDTFSPIASQTDAAYNKLEVFYLDSAQNVEALFFDNGLKTWSHKNITAAAGAAPAKTGSPLVSLVNSYAGTIQVDYLDGAGHIWQLYSADRVTWHTINLSASAGALPVASNSPLVGLVNPLTSSVDVYYIGTDGIVHQLWWSATWGWNSNAPGAIAGAPNPASGSALVGLVKMDTNSINLYYLTPDHHIRELWWNSSAGWQSDDVTAATGGAVNAAAGSTLATIEVPTYPSPTVQLYYFDSNWKLKQLSFTNGWWGQYWSAGDPTSGTGAPNAAPGSPVVSVVNTRAWIVQVHYIAADKHVHELWWDGTWHTDDVTNNAAAYPAIP